MDTEEDQLVDACNTEPGGRVVPSGISSCKASNLHRSQEAGHKLVLLVHNRGAVSFLRGQELSVQHTDRLVAQVKPCTDPL